jgi:hypothetical protein
MKNQCALWMVFSEACGDHVVAELAQDTLADKFEAEQQRLQNKKETLTIKCPGIHKVALSYE